MLRHSPFIVGRGCGNGTAILVLVGVQHEVALGGVECVISGMSGSVVKNGGALYTAATITYVNEISGCGGKSTTCSFRFTFLATRSINGTLK